MASQSDSGVNNSSNCSSQGAIFTTLLADRFGPATFCMTVGKRN